MCCIQRSVYFHFYSIAAATAKSLQSCLTLCNPIDDSPPGSPVPGILQARTLERGAISFSNSITKSLQNGLKYLCVCMFDILFSTKIKRASIKYNTQCWCSIIIYEEGIVCSWNLTMLNKILWAYALQVLFESPVKLVILSSGEDL